MSASLSHAAGAPDVLRRLRAAVDDDTCDGNPCELERLVVEQSNPMLVGALGELLAETEIVVAVHRRQRSGVGRGQTGEHVGQITSVRELNAVTQNENQVDLRLREPRERGVGAPVEVLGLEGVDPARACRLELAVEIAEDADAHYAWSRSSSSARAATSIVCSRQPGAKGDCCSW